MVAFLYYEKLEHIKKTDLLRTCITLLQRKTKWIFQLIQSTLGNNIIRID